MSAALAETIREVAKLREINAELLKALQEIAAIPNSMTGGDWDEIDEARAIAVAAMIKIETT